MERDSVGVVSAKAILVAVIFASTAVSAAPVKTPPTKRAKLKKESPPKVAPPKVVPPCNADELQQRGDELRARGNYMAAAAEYQKAIDCSPTENRYLRAGYALCSVNRCKPPPQPAVTIASSARTRVLIIRGG